MQTHPRFFCAPPAPRRIVAGFSYLQRIGKGAQTRVWFPPSLQEDAIEWAAVRQFELFQEADNLVIDALEVSEIKRSFQAWAKMRSGGYRVTILTLGAYAPRAAEDDLYILDLKMQEEITRLIHFLYLSEQSGAASSFQEAALEKNDWQMESALPHVAEALAVRSLFKPEKQRLAEKTFFEILKRLPQDRILHEIAFGLSLPDASKEKNWVYVAGEEHRAASFFGSLGEVMGERIHAHMRGHYDRSRHSFAALKAA